MAVRRKGSATAVEATAESVAYERGLSTLENPPPGIDANRLDELWTALEPRVPAAISRLADHTVLQALRLAGFRNAIPQVSSFRWRVLEAPEDAPRFVLNDSGFSVITEQGRTTNGLFVPFGPRIALLGYHDARPGFHDRRVLTPMSVRWLNTATWEEPWPREVYCHPDDQEGLVALGPIAQIKVNQDGPYRGWGRSHTLFGTLELLGGSLGIEA